MEQASNGGGGGCGQTDSPDRQAVPIGEEGIIMSGRRTRNLHQLRLKAFRGGGNSVTTQLGGGSFDSFNSNSIVVPSGTQTSMIQQSILKQAPNSTKSLMKFPSHD
jgi:hypothetical protein